MTDTTEMPAAKGPLIYRQSIWTRVTHWIWAICLFFLLLTGLQIFNAHPALYIGQQSGFEFENAILDRQVEAFLGNVDQPVRERNLDLQFGKSIHQPP